MFSVLRKNHRNQLDAFWRTGTLEEAQDIVEKHTGERPEPGVVVWGEDHFGIYSQEQIIASTTYLKGIGMGDEV